MAKSECWLDVDGAGPFAQKGFTYCQSCVDAKVAANRSRSTATRCRGAAKRLHRPGHRAELDHAHRQAARRPAVRGWLLAPYVLPGQDLRGGARGRARAAREGAADTGFELLRGAHHREAARLRGDDRGHHRRGVEGRHRHPLLVRPRRHRAEPHKRTTYGWGCVYPVDVMLKSAEAVEKRAAREDGRQGARARAACLRRSRRRDRETRSQGSGRAALAAGPEEPPPLAGSVPPSTDRALSPMDDALAPSMEDAPAPSANSAFAP